MSEGEYLASLLLHPSSKRDLKRLLSLLASPEVFGESGRGCSAGNETPRTALGSQPFFEKAAGHYSNCTTTEFKDPNPTLRWQIL